MPIGVAAARIRGRLTAGGYNSGDGRQRDADERWAQRPHQGLGGRDRLFGLAGNDPLYGGDGIDDVIVGAPGNAGGGYYLAGAAYVVFGRPSGFSSLVDLTDIAAGRGGFKIQGGSAHQSAYGYAGSSVSAAGDVNGDGIDDVIVGAPHHRHHQTYSGAAYVVFGRTDGFTSPVDLDEIAAGSGGFKIQGENPYDQAGSSVSAAGDVNGDGLDDLIVGAPVNGFSGYYGARCR